MPLASSIILTKGTSPGPAPAGKKRLYFREDDTAFTIDDQGNEVELGSGGSGGSAVEHEWSDTSVRFKNPDGSWGDWIDLKGADGVPGADGSIPAHEWAGTNLRFQNPDTSWGPYVNLKGELGDAGTGTNSMSPLFARANRISQSHENVSSFAILWDHAVRNQPTFIIGNDSSEIVVQQDCWIELSYKLIFQTWQDEEYTLRSAALLDGVEIPESTSYGMVYKKDTGFLVAMVCNPIPVYVTTGQVIQIESKTAKKTQFISRADIATVTEESIIVIRTEV